MDVWLMLGYAAAALLALWSLTSLVTRRRQSARVTPAATAGSVQTGAGRLGKVPEHYSFDI